jgi:tRNA uridine 5-carboxymethylaminomethyl modification enzyme
LIFPVYLLFVFCLIVPRGTQQTLGMFKKYDVIVVGAGHAGCEAAVAAARMNCSVLLVTMNMGTIAQMSCNPAMGGVAKGQLVREIDAMGGYSGIVTDKTMIQFRMLNRSKGPAMWSPRAQSDRMAFAAEWRYMLEQTPNIDFWQEMVTGLVTKGDKVCGVKTSLGLEIPAETVVLTNGTFLNGKIHIGEKQFGGGRSGESAAHGITEQLIELGFEAGRMKTGTPPRIDGRSLNYDKFEEQPGDENPGTFSYTPTQALTKQRSCHIAYTNERVHKILEKGFEKSPMFTGRIQGLGPRYCPSIEDKIVRFADRDRHQLFIEPEGWNTVEIYLNGFSSSLPEHVQQEALHQIPGFENAKMFRPGYAIEYDYFPPQQLQPHLETRTVHNLFFAGQINGTTGYEEAAAQGQMAGINAALRVKDLDPFILGRDEAYIGVLIDDLVHKGTDEPYRMFTSRAEYRILLRQDNADIRLTEKAAALGLISEEQLKRFRTKKETVERIESLLSKMSAAPEEVNSRLESIGSHVLTQKQKLAKLITRPEMSLDILAEMLPEFKAEIADCGTEEKEQAEINVKYAGYILREKEQAARVHRLDAVPLPEGFDYHKIKALSNEGREKLTNLKPRSLGQASRISGVSPADISVLMVYMGR